ncbi:MAG: hypothetical protein PHT94_01960 [Candidatus Nanoarchaeia archaeon]|nr:hypothetical protein [Candidatus Nanoarchaeia archaeon]
MNKTIKITKKTKNKKSQLGVVASILITSLVLLLMFFFLSNYRSQSESSIDDQNCKNALEMSRITQRNDMSECKMHTIKINQKTLDKLYIKSNLNLHSKLKDEEGQPYFSQEEIKSNTFKINKIIADEMARTWALVNEGEMNPFNKKDLLSDRNETRYCLVSSAIYFDEEDFKDDKKIEIPLALNSELFGTELLKNSFFYFLLYNNYKEDKDLSYFDFLSDVDSTLGNYANVVLPIFPEKNINTDRMYYIIYRKTYYKENTLDDALITGIVGTMMFSQLGGIAGFLTKGATAITSATQAVKSSVDIFFEKGVDNLILIDNSSYNENKFKESSICDIFVNMK